MTELIVRRTAAWVRERYVFPEPGAAAAALIEARLAEGAYDGLTDQDLCARLTEDLRSVAPDRHLRVVWHEDPVPEHDGDRWEDPEVLAEYWPQARAGNHGVVRVERLDANVGYLDLRGIDEAEETGRTLTAAMTLLQYTSALLLDLRQNTGGAPSGVAYLCSFFFDSEPVHLNDVYRRATDSIRQFWTQPYLAGPRYLNRPVFVLIGPGTFSGGEELAYNLQQLKRATLIGEATRGGAHPTSDYWVAPHVTVRVPGERSINPVSGTNWEGVGVQPDIAVPAERAFEEGYRLALSAVLAGLGDGPADQLIRKEAQDRPESSR